MKKNLTHIAVLLDRSGSMCSLREATLESLNSFIDQQKKVPGDAWLTFAQFSDQFEVVRNAINLKEFKSLSREDFVPRGGTALYDAMGALMDIVGKKSSDLPEEERPENIIMVVLTDGHENCSKNLTADLIKSKVKHQEEVYSWKFLFLGANIDAFAVGQTLGMRGITYNATTQGMGKSVDAASAYVGYSRTGNVRSAEAILKSKKIDDSAIELGVKEFKSNLGSYDVDSGK
jgi:uncharacterized protein YegL